MAGLLAAACGSDLDPAQQAGAEELLAAGVLEPLELPGDAEWAEPATPEVPEGVAVPFSRTARLVELCGDPDELGARIGAPTDAAASELWQAYAEGWPHDLSGSPPTRSFRGIVRTAALVYADDDAAEAAYRALDTSAVNSCIVRVADEVVEESEAMFAAGQSDFPVSAGDVGDLSRIRTTETDLGLADESRLFEHSIDVAVFGGYDHEYLLDLAVVRRGAVLLVATVGFDNQGVDPGPSAATARAVSETSLAAVDAVLAGRPLPTPTTVDPAAAADEVVAAMALDAGDLPAGGGWEPADAPSEGPLASCLAAGLATGGTGGEPIAVADPAVLDRPGRAGGREVVAVTGVLYASRRDAQIAFDALDLDLPCAAVPSTSLDVGERHVQAIPLLEVGDQALLFEAFPLPEASGARPALDVVVLRRDRAVVVLAGEEPSIPADDPDLPAVPAGEFDTATLDGIALGGLVVDLVGPVDAALADALG